MTKDEIEISDTLATILLVILVVGAVAMVMYMLDHTKTKEIRYDTSLGRPYLVDRPLQNKTYSYHVFAKPSCVVITNNENITAIRCGGGA